MNPGATYRHKSCLDMDIYVHKVTPIKEGLEVVMTLFDRRHNYIYEQGQTYIIKAEELPNWDKIA